MLSALKWSEPRSSCTGLLRFHHLGLHEGMQEFAAVFHARRTGGPALSCGLADHDGIAYQLYLRRVFIGQAVVGTWAVVRRPLSSNERMRMPSISSHCVSG